MDQSFNIEAILGRRKEIATAVDLLLQEDKELEIALRVAERFGKGVPSVPEGNKLGPTRPADAPALIDMVNSVLKDALAAGKPGLGGKDLVSAIGDKFWPGVQPAQVMPSIYTFVGKKRLKKGDNGIFKPV